MGLGPEGVLEGLSYPISLYQQKKIDKIRVGLNYENPLYKDRVSTITFGYFDYSHIHNGTNGLNWFPNKGKDNWSVMLDDLKYNGVDL